MLRKITVVCAVVLAMLAAPATLPAHSMSGFGGMHSSGGMHSFGGMHSVGMASRSRGVHTFSHRANFPRHRFAHFHHFRHRHLFASAKSFAPGHHAKGIHGASFNAPGHEKKRLHMQSARRVAPGHLKN
jgi:hypothetical protein